ncbi:MarR family winged helix-turn-helix transcriptional regulator [Kitasatospora sp. NPDC048540]|uniref:MarR family winged helix-turn-helix transcriptional regulator n=1 Tax=unclassified Kitasatospora TaxID=2633591 RepID=UPI00053A0102|nr:MarR family winged helix-turn-helix transcriptional regulator [Kitasatospora sp. MBT63]
MGQAVYDRRGGPTSPSEWTVRLLAETGRAVETLLAGRLRARGLAPLHRSVLEVLAEHGPHARADLARQLAVDPPGIASAVEDLVARGLVQVLVVHIGGRQEVVTVTDAGKAALGAALDDARAVQDLVLGSLTRGERTQLQYMLRRVCAAAQRAAADTASS